MAKFNNKLASRIVEMVEQDLFGVSEICKILHIAPKTFYEWKKEKPEFKEAIEDAVNHREEVLISSARMGLKQLLEGYVQKKEKITYIPDKNNPGDDIEKCRVVEKKFCPPSIRAIKYVLDREERRKEKQQLNNKEKRPLIIEVQDEETKRQLMIFRKNDCCTGGGENPEIVAAVDKELEEERKLKAREQKVVKSEQVEKQDEAQEQPPVAPVEKPKPNPYPFLPPGYTSRTD